MSLWIGLKIRKFTTAVLILVTPQSAHRSIIQARLDLIRKPLKRATKRAICLVFESVPMGSFFPVLRRNCAHWSICDITEHKCVTVLTLRPDAKKLRLTAADCAVCDAMRPQLCRSPHTATKCEEIVTCNCFCHILRSQRCRIIQFTSWCAIGTRSNQQWQLYWHLSWL